MKLGCFTILVFMVLLLHSPVFAAATITGTVTGMHDGKPLSGAHVVIMETGQGSITGPDGRYICQIAKAGKYRIRVSYLGFVPQERSIKTTDLQTLSLDFSLRLQVYETAEVEITDLRPERDEQSVPRRMDLITAQTITENPGQNITSVLDYISGVNLSSTMGVFASNTVVTLRGLSGNDQGRTLVLVDDMPLNKSDEGSVNWNLINRDNVERIEVTKGPGSARYGSSAMGGVISITTKRPAKRISGTATVGYGTFNTLGFRYALSGIIGPESPAKGFFYDLNGFYKRSDGYNAEIPEYLEPGDTFTVNTFLKEASIGTKIGYRFNEKNSIGVSAGFYNDKRGRGIEIYEVDGANERHGTWQASLQYQGNHKNLSWNINAFTINEYFQRVNEYLSEAEYNLYLVKSIRSDLGLLADMEILAGKYQKVTTGFEFRQGSVDGQDIYYTSTDLISNAGKMESYALFIQDAFLFAHNRLQADLGIRLNYAVFHDGLFTIENPSYSIEYMVPFQDTLIPAHAWFQADPKLSVQYRFDPENRIYISVSRGFRAPNLDDLCRTGKKRNGFKISNPSLKPEFLDNYETGADLLLFKKLHLAPSVYYSVGHDFMYYVSTGDSVNMGYKVAPVFQKQNISRVDIWGAEIDVDIEPVNWLSLFANYAFAHSTISRFVPTDPAVDSNLTGKFLTDVPMHKITAGATWKNRIVSLNVLWKYVSSRWINDQNEPDPVLKISKFPAYSTFNLRAWHTFFKRLVVAVNIDNLFNLVYIDDRLQQSPGRMINAEITINF
ncbi:MAG: TonB-dependent receptor [Bacteroidota bacterium]